MGFIFVNCFNNYLIFFGIRYGIVDVDKINLQEVLRKEILMV